MNKTWQNDKKEFCTVNPMSLIVNNLTVFLYIDVFTSPTLGKNTSPSARLCPDVAITNNYYHKSETWVSNVYLACQHLQIIFQSKNIFRRPCQNVHLLGLTKQEWKSLCQYEGERQPCFNVIAYNLRNVPKCKYWYYKHDEQYGFVAFVTDLEKL